DKQHPTLPFIFLDVDRATVRQFHSWVCGVEDNGRAEYHLVHLPSWQRVGELEEHESDGVIVTVFGPDRLLRRSIRSFGSRKESETLAPEQNVGLIVGS